MSTNTLKIPAQRALFVSSYAFLFIMIIMKPFFYSTEFLNWGGLNKEAILCYVQYFGLPSFLTIVLLYWGFWGNYCLLKNLKTGTATNGINVKVDDVKNRNSEAISYIATYIIPFISQGSSSGFEIFSFSAIMFVIYKIYKNSSLLLINPGLNIIGYTLYEITYFYEKQGAKTVMIITKEPDISDEDSLKIYKIGHKLYFAQKRKA